VFRAQRIVSISILLSRMELLLWTKWIPCYSSPHQILSLRYFTVGLMLWSPLYCIATTICPWYSSSFYLSLVRWNSFGDNHNLWMVALVLVRNSEIYAVYTAIWYYKSFCKGVSITSGIHALCLLSNRCIYLQYTYIMPTTGYVL